MIGYGLIPQYMLTCALEPILIVGAIVRLFVPGALERLTGRIDKDTPGLASIIIFKAIPLIGHLLIALIAVMMFDALVIRKFIIRSEIAIGTYNYEDIALIAVIILPVWWQSIVAKRKRDMSLPEVAKQWNLLFILGFLVFAAYTGYAFSIKSKISTMFAVLTGINFVLMLAAVAKGKRTE